MKKVKLENVNSHLKEKLKDKEFRVNYDLERAKVALAQKIAELRQRCNLRQVDLAQRLHVSQQFISQIETAQENNLTLDTLAKIASSLGSDITLSFTKASSKTPHLIIN